VLYRIPAVTAELKRNLQLWVIVYTVCLGHKNSRLECDMQISFTATCTCVVRRGEKLQNGLVQVLDIREDAKNDICFHYNFWKASFFIICLAGDSIEVR
jgi:hypothetical protein